MKPGILLFVLVLAVYQAPAQTSHRRHARPEASHNIAETIQKLEGELRIATMKCDASWFEDHLIATYTETDAQGKLHGRDEVIQYYRTAQPEYDSWNLSDGTARTFNDNTVILTGILQVQGAAKDKNLSGNFRFTRVWIKAGTEWELASSQMTRIAG